MSADERALRTVQDVVGFVSGLSGTEGLQRLLDRVFPALYAVDPSASELEVALKAAAKACGVSLPSVKSDWKRYVQTHPSEADEAGGTSQADRLVKELLEDPALELFHDPASKAFVRLPVGDHFETWPVEGKRFRTYLFARAYELDGRVPNREAVAGAVKIAEYQATRGDSRELHNRLGEHDSALWYDLADDSWRAVKITAAGWEVVSLPPAIFRRYPHQLPQVPPARGGDPRLLLKYVNLRSRTATEGEEDDAAGLLFLVLLVVAFVASVPRIAFILAGPQGAGKSSLLRLVRRLLDPSSLETMTASHDADTLAMTLEHHACAPFDNLSDGDWGRVNDPLCRAITGDAQQRRALYTDDDAVIRRFRRFVIINGIDITGIKTDLLDRSALFELDRIAASERREEGEMWAEFERDRPAILGGILDTLSAAMRGLREARERMAGRLPRMADATVWGYAVAEALGGCGEAFLAAYLENRKVQSAQVLESDPLAVTVTAFMARREPGEAGRWRGKPKELLEALARVAETEGVYRNDKEWPKSPAALGTKLRKLSQSLREGGIAFGSRKANGVREITLAREDSASAAPADPAVPNPVQHAGYAGTAPRAADPAGPWADPEARPGRVSTRDLGGADPAADPAEPLSSTRTGTAGSAGTVVAGVSRQHGARETAPVLPARIERTRSGGIAEWEG